MAITTAEANRDELVRAARLLGENLSRRAFGERGPDLNVTLLDLEQFLQPLVEAMAGGFLAVAAGEQTDRLAETLPCPTCGRECSRTEHERTVTAEHGPFTWSEPACHCSYCERSFFPSARRAQD
jgi:hypothetical protein